MKFSRTLAAVALTAAAPLTACSPIDVFGPHPDGDLLTLARQAEADAGTLDGDAAGMREFHARQLFDEITRLCGTDSAGLPPSSCEVERGPGDATGAKDDVAAAVALTDALVTQSGKLPDESVPLVVAQAVDLTASLDAPGSDDWDFPVPEEPIADESVAETAAGLIKEEHAVQFGLDLASAYADDELQARIDNLRPLHDMRIDAMRDAFPDLPPRAPGYEVDGGGPTNPGEAAAFVDNIEATLVDRWRTAASDAFTEDAPAEWRTLVIHLAAHAQHAANTA
ncbi:hypothetical protein KBX19_08255 [Corynebacterium sp. CCUG 71335]|uniref:hypothetical protein n=1 Tax=unclassified Corynebacterium TaxID=2624378 RepID=UPI00210C3FBD|nr:MULTISPECIES: hypothetical protein [unclassified Corynebacterium]MCQ4621203.1 hypothetical protein [Corynebacterium sp. CCUG 71335]MCQ4622859.1 hypothetical protein [Corynebacterium sp. CCUG 70398]